MKFPRSARIFRGHLDFAPFASVFFLLILFALLGTFIYTPGVKVELALPQADDLTGTDQPTIAVAVTADGQYFYENQPVQESVLSDSLKQAVGKSLEPLTLLVRADKAVAHGRVVQLEIIARDAGITNVLEAVLPRVFSTPAAKLSRKP